MRRFSASTGPHGGCLCRKPLEGVCTLRNKSYSDHHPILARSSQQQPGSDLPRGYLAACRSSVPGAGLQPYVYSLHNKKFSDVLSCHTLPTPSLFLTALSSPLPPTPNGASGMPRYSFNQRPAQHGPMRTCTNTHVNQSRTQKYRKPAIEYSHDRKYRHSLVFLL